MYPFISGYTAKVAGTETGVPSAYDTTARKLADLFRKNCKKYESGVSAEIKAAGPA